jgi:hypothetical protein
LNVAPLVLWGHSAAGSFVSTFAALHPERTVGFVRYHSAGAGLLGTDVKALRQTPALLLVAEMDAQQSPDAETAWKIGRELDAPWTFGVEPNAAHGGYEALEAAKDLLIPWITVIVRQRISPDGGPLRILSDASAWLGSNQSGDVTSWTAFRGSKTTASWLPDETTARAWQRIVQVKN